MSNKRKISPKVFPALAAIAIVFIITNQLQKKYSSNKIFVKSYSQFADTTKTKRGAKVPNKVLKRSLDSAVKSAPDTPRRRIIDTTIKRGNTATIRDSPSRTDTITTDTLVQVTDTFNLKLSRDTLDAPITYAASDSGVLLIPSRQFILYGKASTKYTDIEVNAATINLDQTTQLIKAYGAKDTTGNPSDNPKLTQGETVSNSDSIFFNLRSQKGLTKSTYLQEGEMYVYANTIKKIDNNTLYAWRGRFTTCNLDTPHFAFRTRKMKIVNKKLAVSGPAFPEFEGVPAPIGIPFGIYPLNRGRHSGFLPPQFAANEDFGLGLEGLGFYKVLNEHFDVTVRSNIYSYGGWNVNTSSRYTKRYMYTGGWNLAIQNTKILNRGGATKEEFTRNKSFMVSWNHSRDPKARPGSTFSANVNAGSTKFNRFVPNNTLQNFQNQLSSSITYSKDWRGKYNFTASANHNQNNNSRLINLNLPSANFSVVTFYPLQKREQVGTPKWYEKLGIGYTGNFQNQFSFYDSAFSLRRLVDTAQWGATHSIPISLSLPSLGPVQIAPGISYEERWYGQTNIKRWDDSSKQVINTINRGLYAYRQMSYGISANTRVFGTFQFNKARRVQAIRHEIRPNFSLSYVPDLNKRFYSRVQIDTARNFVNYSTLDGGVGGGGRAGNIGFGVDNTLEMKVRNPKDTTKDGIKKVRIIDGFGFNGSYNLLADSFPLSALSVYFRTNLFEKINITAATTLDPYQIDARGFRQNKFMWAGDRFRVGRITNGSVAVSTSLQSKSKDGKTDKDRIQADQFMTPDEQQRQLDYVRSNPAEFTDFNIPWSLQLSYSLSFTRQLSQDFSRQQTLVYSNVSLNGDFSLTPKWKMGANTYFDFTTNKIQTFTMFVSRDMHCWQMSINLTPVGLYRSFNITLNPKSGILRDLRVNRSRFFYQ
jgi:LPS-assembly protein